MVQKVTKKINPDLSDVKRSNRKDTRDRIGQFVVEAILDHVGEAKSPVKGAGQFKALKKGAYRDFKKAKLGTTKANMELKGDMLDALKFKIDSRNKIEIGIFIEDQNQVNKADNHNKFSAKSKKTKVPKRPFIPDSSKDFNNFIEKGISRIIEEAKDASDN